MLDCDGKIIIWQLSLNEFSIFFKHISYVERNLFTICAIVFPVFFCPNNKLFYSQIRRNGYVQFWLTGFSCIVCCSNIPTTIPRLIYWAAFSFCIIHLEDGYCKVHWNIGTISTHDVAKHRKPQLHRIYKNLRTKSKGDNMERLWWKYNYSFLY